MARPVTDITGQKFNRWTAVRFIEVRNHNAYWLFRCECGTEKIYKAAYIKTGVSKSCGCFHNEISSQSRKYKDVERDESNIPVLYRRYYGIKQRCYNPNHDSYMRYGGRGIKMCDEWKDSFQAFNDWAYANGYEEGLTLDRIDVDGDYCPENCRWVDMRTQLNNTRKNVYIEYMGRKLTIPEWAHELNMKESLIRHRYDYGWTPERIFTTPVKREHHPEAHDNVIYMTYKGVTKSLRDWSDETGISITTLRHRYVDYHWTPEDTIEVPKGTPYSKFAH